MDRRALWTGILAALAVMVVASFFERPLKIITAPPRAAASAAPVAAESAAPPSRGAAAPSALPVAMFPGGPNMLPAGAPVRPVSTPLSTDEAPPSNADAGPDASPSPAIDPQAAVEAVRDAIQKYGSMFNGNPVGTNAEITKALNGDNPAHARFLDGVPGQINSNGELVDPWGTPYFFHQLSGHDMEVRSAGPDRIMWTSDDIRIP